MDKIQHRLPKQGRSTAEVISAMEALKSQDVNWRSGKTFSLVFQGGEDIDQLSKEAYLYFFSENGLNPTAFPSLRHFETDVVAMSAGLLGGDRDVVGNMTSGGTESILMAVKTARDWARDERPNITAPEMILPVSAHPAFPKAGHYFGVKPVFVPVGPDYRAEPEMMRAALSPRTILVIGSAPSYPHGVVDPIRELAKLAREAQVLCHVDACVGGFMLPFVRKLGYDIPDFDFQVAGVTSISADLHKYGYAAKGASVILYRSKDLRRRQFYAFTDWPGGIYVSPTMTGTRPGGAIAAAWAVMNHLGEEGYLRITAQVMDTVHKIRQGIEAIPKIKIIGEPHMSILAIGSDQLDIYEVGDEMTEQGWHLDRQQFPPSLHLTVHYGHAKSADKFLEDLSGAVSRANKPSITKFKNQTLLHLANLASRTLPEKTVSALMARASALVGVKGAALPGRTAAMYGLIGTLPNRGDLNELVLDLLDQMTRPDVEE